MNIPIETIFAMLAIEMFRELAGPEDLSPPGAGIVLGATAGWIALQYALAASLARRTRRRLRRASGTTAEIVEDFRFRQVVHRVLLVVLCLVHIFVTRWPIFVETRLGLRPWWVLDDVAAIAPFVAAMAAGWLATYRADKMLGRRPWGIAEYVWFQARYSLLLVLLPWLVLKGIDDSREVWPGKLKELSGRTSVSVAIFAVLVALAAVFLPLFLKWLFGAVSMPPSERRERLERLARKAGLRFRDVLVWRMARARILNAGVMGIVPRYRYVLFSDALLDSLSPDECEAVLGHEIGHTRHRHVLVYLVFTLGFVALAYNFMSLLPPGFRTGLLFQADPSGFLVVMPLLAVLVGVYFRLVFGVLSRAFEREADVYSAALLGTPVPLILALEKIALMSGDVRTLSSWRHHSVAERVRFLSLAGYDPAEQERCHRYARTLVRMVLAAVALLFAAALYVSLREPEGLAARIAVLEEKTREGPERHQLWMRLAELRAEAGADEAALAAAEEALARHPSSEFIERARRTLGRLAVPDAVKLAALASAFERAGRADLALPEARKAVEADPEDAAARLALARALLVRDEHELYDPKAAAEAAAKALDIERADGGEAGARTYEVLGRALAASGRADEGAQVVGEGLALHPGDEALEALGKLLTRSRGTAP